MPHHFTPCPAGGGADAAVRTDARGTVRAADSGIHVLQGVYMCVPVPVPVRVSTGAYDVGLYCVCMCVFM